MAKIIALPGQAVNASASVPAAINLGDLNDAGNARRFVERHGGDLKYDCGASRWLVWDGRRYAPDLEGAVKERAKEVVAEFYREAEVVQDATVLAHARRSGNERSINSMIRLATSDPHVRVTPAQLDTDQWLLNFNNGTVDLRTGELREHRREYLITKVVAADYDGIARSKAFESFLSLVLPSKAHRRLLQRVCGYMLTGVTDLDKVFVLQGPGGTGKTTFVEAFKAALGDYAMTTPMGTLAKAMTGKVRNDIARLPGARVVTASESESSEAVAEALLKLLSGGDTIASRFMFKEFFEFIPQFKILLVTNHFPRLSNDSGIWRRVIRIGFDDKIPASKLDPEFKRQLREDPEVRAAILAWAVEGCLDWQKRPKKKLPVPSSIETGTRLFRPESYEVAYFITERCKIHPEARVEVAKLYPAYLAWAMREQRPKPAWKTAKFKPLGVKDFNKTLTHAGLKQGKIGSGSLIRVWNGLRLR